MKEEFTEEYIRYLEDTLDVYATFIQAAEKVLSEEQIRSIRG